MSGLALRTVQEELLNLSAAGLVTNWTNGYHRFYRANPDHELFSCVTQIVRTSARLPRIKKQALRRKKKPRPTARRSSIGLGPFRRPPPNMTG